MRVGPHPHIGLQTVTWLLDGEVLHRDSLGNVQPIRPGQLNLMTAGAGIAHAEVSPDPHPRWLHGLQLWVALPDARPVRAAGFRASSRPPGARDRRGVGDRPRRRRRWRRVTGDDLLSLGRGRRAGFGRRAGRRCRSSPASSTRCSSSPGRSSSPANGCRPATASTSAATAEQLVVAGEPAGRFLLLGGEPFAEPLVMWWNFVGRTADEIAGARADWEAGRRFGSVAENVAGESGERVPAPPLPPGRLTARRWPG